MRREPGLKGRGSGTFGPSSSPTPRLPTTTTIHQMFQDLPGEIAKRTNDQMATLAEPNRTNFISVEDCSVWKNLQIAGYPAMLPISFVQ